MIAYDRSDSIRTFFIGAGWGGLHTLVFGTVFCYTLISLFLKRCTLKTKYALAVFFGAIFTLTLATAANTHDTITIKGTEAFANEANTHDTLTLKGTEYVWEVKVLPAPDCKATAGENEHPVCAYHVVKKGETLSHIAARYSTKEHRMSVKDILATGNNRTEVAKRVTPRLKKISAEEGHWIFPGQIIFLPLATPGSIAAARAVQEAAAALLAQKAARDRRMSSLRTLRNIFSAVFIAVIFLLMIFSLIKRVGWRTSYESAPRTPEERNKLMDSPDWNMGDPEKHDAKNQPRD